MYPLLVARRKQIRQSDPTHAATITDKSEDYAGFKNAKPEPTPLPLFQPLYEKKKLVTDVNRKEMGDVPYLYVLGSQLYLAITTRPDVATEVFMLEKFQDARLNSF